MSHSIAAASTQTTYGSAGRQSPPPPQGLPSGSKDHASPSRLSKFVDNNRQTSAGTSREALRRYFSSTDRPGMVPQQDSVEASVAWHEDKVKGVIDVVEQAMEQQKIDAAMEQQKSSK